MFSLTWFRDLGKMAWEFQDDDLEQQMTKRVRVPQALQGSAYFEVTAALDNVATRMDHARGGVGQKIKKGVVVEAFLAYCVTRSEDEQSRIFDEGREIIRRRIESTEEPGPPLSPSDAIHRAVTGAVQPGASATVVNPGKGKN